MTYTEAVNCRICGNPELSPVIDLGCQFLTGRFPRSIDDVVARVPLTLVRCTGGKHACGLVQLRHSYEPEQMYGDNYGYRSGLNPSMTRHLTQKVAKIVSSIDLDERSLVIDIGSNDGTTLSAYPGNCGTLVGVDPTGNNFRHHYPEHVQLLPDFFSSRLIKHHFGAQKASVVTSFSMFYDLERPMDFMREVAEILADDGIWVSEQSYLPTMLKNTAYDTICHEHLEYYALRQIDWMAEGCGLKMLDVEFNDVNGGSFSVVLTHSRSARPASESVTRAREKEAGLRLDESEIFERFVLQVESRRNELLEFVSCVGRQERRLAGLGASTKGNVLLQYCGLTGQEVEVIGEVNPDKFGCFTPGSLIPIVDEADVLASDPDYLLVLPWHFRKFFTGNQRFAGRSLVFPLPRFEITG